MRFRNVSHLNGLEHGAMLIFFAQAINELTFDYSLDSYKAPSVSVPSLVREAREQVYLLESVGDAIPPSSLNPIIDELVERLAGNIVVSKLHDIDRGTLSRLRGPLDTVRRTLDIVSNELNPNAYAAASMNLIYDAIKDGSKSEVYFLSRELVSTLENMGMSRAHIYFTSQKFFYDKSSGINDIEDLRKFFSLIYPHFHDFTIALKISSFGGSIDQEHFNAFGLELKSDVRDNFDNLDPGHSAFDISDDQVFLLCGDIEAYDRFSAIEKAVEKASLLQNLFRLYHHAEKLEIENEVIVAQCCVDEVAICNRHSNKMMNVEDERPKKAGSRLKDLVGSSKLLRGNDSSRLISLAEFHGMGIDSATVENQIINLWISFETIAPSRPGHSKISNVIAAILPVTALSYTHRIVRRAAIDLLTWNRFRTMKSFKSVPAANDQFYGFLLSALTQKSYNDVLADIFTQLRDFELLRYRLFRMHETFSDPGKLLASIDAHQRRVEWQIRRIYRARNSIVHRGTKPPFANQLVDNAHEYLDQAINMTIDVSKGMSGMEDYQECFDYLAWEHESYISRLRNLDTFDDETAGLTVWQRGKSVSRAEVLIAE